jgi:2,3-bisphosphoglycerate-independent phosphoglycerate mutase
MPQDYIKNLLIPNKTKIVLLVLDGLGGLPNKPGGQTELEAANTPHMDQLAKEGALGLSIPIRPGITPGSGPAHLALFGYDPLVYDIGRGALEAVGAGLDLKPGDVAARGNFCTVDTKGNITDRRADRISSEEAFPIIEKISTIQVPGVEIITKLVKEYRFAVLMRGAGLDDRIEDTDPQKTGVPPLPAIATHPEAEHTAELYNQWINKSRQLIVNEPKANSLNLRGFATDPSLPKYKDIYGINAACIAVYPMYRGVSSLVGMDVLDFPGDTPADEFKAAAKTWQNYDFFFIHIKKTDSKGEDGDFDGKVSIIEGVDNDLPVLLDLEPDVLLITGDHSTPSNMRSHSWHPVPFLLWAPLYGLPDLQTKFGERHCASGSLGTFLATDAMPLALAHASRLEKFGA